MRYLIDTMLEISYKGTHTHTSSGKMEQLEIITGVIFDEGISRPPTPCHHHRSTRNPRMIRFKR